MPGTLVEKIYYRLPGWAQNAAFSLKGLQLRRQRYNRHFRQRLAELRESDRWPADRIEELKAHRLGELLRHARATVPYYRDLEIDHPDALSAWPILTKQMAREHQDELVSDAFRRRRLIPLLTSGTTGTPLCVRATRESQGFQWAIWWRHKQRFGLEVGDRHLVFGARVPVSSHQAGSGFWRHDLAQNRVYLSTYHLTPANMPGIVAWLNTQQFAFFTGYPSAMYVLAQFIRDSGLELRNNPRVIVTGADALLPRFERLIREVFGAPVTEAWGMTEFAGSLSKCEQGRFHEDFECCHVEALPIDGGEPDHCRLVCTGWGNPAMPFIRYDVGDYARTSPDPCPCGRESRSFISIDGRTEDYLRTADGKMAIGMNQVLEYATGAREIQLYQERLDEVQVRVVPGAAYGEGDVAALTRELRRRLGDEIGIRFVMMTEIPRTATGKFRAVVSTLQSSSQGEEDLRDAMRR